MEPYLLIKKIEFFDKIIENFVDWKIIDFFVKFNEAALEKHSQMEFVTNILHFFDFSIKSASRSGVDSGYF